MLPPACEILRDIVVSRFVATIDVCEVCRVEWRGDSDLQGVSHAADLPLIVDIRNGCESERRRAAWYSGWI
eukprot:6186770-Pleurochrysis_carterae.AAC.3